MTQIESWRFCYLRVPGEYLPRLTPGNFYEPLSPAVANKAAESWAKRHSYLLRENHEITAPIPDRRWDDFCTKVDRGVRA
jgi:hypothetical protein